MISINYFWVISRSLLFMPWPSRAFRFPGVFFGVFFFCTLFLLSLCFLSCWCCCWLEFVILFLLRVCVTFLFFFFEKELQFFLLLIVFQLLCGVPSLRNNVSDLIFGFLKLLSFDQKIFLFVENRFVYWWL